MLNQYQLDVVILFHVVIALAIALAAETTLLNLQDRRLAAAVTLLKNTAGRWDTNFISELPLHAESTR